MTVEIAAHVAAVTRISVDTAAIWSAAFQRALDLLVSDDWSVVAPPLIVLMRDDPVALAFLDWVRTEPAADQAQHFCDGDDQRRANILQLPVDVVTRHSIALRDDLLVTALDVLGVEAEDVGDVFVAAVEAWCETFAARGYTHRTAGAERDLEDWLVGRLDQLGTCGYPVTLDVAATIARSGRGRQVVLSDRSRPDLLCRVTEDTENLRVGDWVVVELKAVRAYPAAVEQLAAYVARVRADVARGSERVHGLLVADGAGGEVRDALSSADLAYLSLGALGYEPLVRQTF